MCVAFCWLPWAGTTEILVVSLEVTLAASIKLKCVRVILSFFAEINSSLDKTNIKC